jgi:hypothetical protein
MYEMEGPRAVSGRTCVRLLVRPACPRTGSRSRVTSRVVAHLPCPTFRSSRYPAPGGAERLNGSGPVRHGHRLPGIRSLTIRCELAA